ncbi:MAG TPA: hypothetical protein VGX69_10015 [Solirubrobacteraceae bacterium]|jgi:hypothetical protein|nr:hypothetical protein [Solirubrobacteraceae bacterium]
MPQTRENTTASTTAHAPASASQQVRQARIAAVVEAAYILEARTR